MLIKFPPLTSLPSAAELKARFARFGSIDLSAIHVFCKSSTCRVVFWHKQDAEAAYKYAIGNKSLFGNLDVRYSVQEVGAPAPGGPETDKSQGDDTSVEAQRVKDPAIDRPVPPAVGPLSLPLSTGQLKSILKKPTDDDAEQVTGGKGGRGTPVKFMLGGEETSEGDQLMVGNRNNFNINASFADGDGAPTTSVAMDLNSKNFKKVIPPSSLPLLLPLPPQFSKPQHNNSYHTEIPSRNLHNFNAPSAAAPSMPTTDISQQMLCLLARCNDVFANVTGLLGYVPYHLL